MKFKKIATQLIVIVIFVFGVTFLWAFSFGDNGLRNQYKLKQQIAHLEKESDSLQAVLELRKGESQRLMTDSFYIESIARTKFGLSKKGEVVYQFLD